MKLAKLAIIVAAISLFAVACGDSAGTNQTANSGGATTTQPTPSASPKATPAATPDELAEAKTTYMQICTNCHQDKGEGGVVKIEGKRLKVPSLLEGHGLEHSDEEFAKQIANGGDGMPAYKDRLNTEQINALVRFIRRDIQAGLTQKPKGH
jgi:mono/diheme cytochrome c family protein